MAKKPPAIDWPKAKVSPERQLTVPLKQVTGMGPAWVEALEFVTGVRNNENGGRKWGSIEVDPESGVITVDEVAEGSEDALAKALDSLVSSAHTAATRAEEAAPAEDEEEDEEAVAAAKAKEMQERFRSPAWTK